MAVLWGETYVTYVPQTIARRRRALCTDRVLGGSLTGLECKPKQSVSMWS